MQQMIINGKVLRYVGQPLALFVRDGDGWAGRTNFLQGESERSAQVEDIEDCFRWLAEWLEDDKSPCSYVLDYASRTVYYDSAEALKDVQERLIPKRNLDGYFENFVQRRFNPVATSETDPKKTCPNCGHALNRQGSCPQCTGQWLQG